MTRHMKASDVEASRIYMFPRTEGPWPEGKRGTVTVTETDDDGEVTTKTQSLDRVGRHIDCSNPRCFGGGVEIGGAITFGGQGHDDRVRAWLHRSGGLAERAKHRRAVLAPIQGDHRDRP